jgi:hypothetical protein
VAREPSSVARPRSVWKPPIPTGPECRLSGARTHPGRLHAPVADTMTRVLEPCLGTKHVRTSPGPFGANRISSSFLSIRGAIGVVSLTDPIGSWKRSVGDPGYSAGTIRGDARQPHQDATRTHRSTGRCGDASTSRGPGQPESVRVLSEWESAREELGPCADSTASSTSSPDGPRPIQSPSRQEFGQSCAAQKRIPVVVRREF